MSKFCDRCGQEMTGWGTTCSACRKTKKWSRITEEEQKQMEEEAKEAAARRVAEILAEMEAKKPEQQGQAQVTTPTSSAASPERDRCVVDLGFQEASNLSPPAFSLQQEPFAVERSAKEQAAEKEWQRIEEEARKAAARRLAEMLEEEKAKRATQHKVPEETTSQFSSAVSADQEHFVLSEHIVEQQATEEEPTEMEAKAEKPEVDATIQTSSTARTEIELHLAEQEAKERVMKEQREQSEDAADKIADETATPCQAAAKAEEERLAAEAAAKAEHERLAAEAAAKAEQERLAAEAAAKAEADRVAAEAAAKAKEEQESVAAEAAAKAEEDRLAAEAASEAEEERLAAEVAAKAEAEKEECLAAEAKAKAEEERLAVEEEAVKDQQKQTEEEADKLADEEPLQSQVEMKEEVNRAEQHEVKARECIHASAPLFRDLPSEVRDILTQGRPLDSKDFRGFTALLRAAERGSAEVVQALAQLNANVNVRSDFGKRAPLHYAAAGGHFDTIQVLLQHGAEVDLQDCGGNRALDLAQSKGHHECVDKLNEWMHKPLVVTVSISSSNGSTSTLRCTSLGGSDIASWSVDPDHEHVAGIRAELMKRFDVTKKLLRLISPTGMLLSEAEDTQTLSQVFKRMSSDT